MNTATRFALLVIIFATSTPLIHAWNVTVTNKAKDDVELRTFIKTNGVPFLKNIIIQGGTTQEIRSSNQIIGVAPINQTVNMGTWTALDTIIKDPADNSAYTIDLSEGTWHVVD